MSLAWKAATLILLNVVITFSAGIVARNVLLNPELAKVEQTNDRKVLHQLSVLEATVRASMRESVSRIKTIASRTESNHWESFATDLSEFAATSDLSYVIAASENGELLQVRQGLNFDYTRIPTPKEIQAIVASAQRADQFPMTDLIQTNYGPLILAADTLPGRKHGPSLFIAVSRIDHQFIDRISAFSGIEITLIDRNRFEAMKQEPRALSGVRSEFNTLHWSADNNAGEPVVTAAISLPPRSYDDKIFTPTIFIALLITCAMWSGAIWLLHRTAIRPMNVASKTLQTILENRDYGKRLNYAHRDEFGRLMTLSNRLLSMVERHTAELETLSLTDPLTGLGNRRAFDTQSKKFWALAERTQTPMALIAFDIDYFKSYNDRYGHPAGDKVIQQFARILESTFKRASDVVARVGGEEFLVLTHDTPSGACLVLANRVLQELRNAKLTHLDNPLGAVSASSGVFHSSPDPNLTLEIALSRVDEILYAAKEDGRNRVMHSDALINHIQVATTAEILQLPRK